MPAWQRVFAHVDMDAFYAAVEVRDDPSLAGKPVAVGGSREGRGVISAASYEARRYGVHSAMPTARALRLCPQLILLPGSFSKYRAVSAQVMEILHSFSPAVEPISLDEAFLDLTGTAAALGSPEEVGRRIKSRIRTVTRLTASAGIAPVKFVAKIASDLEKPDGLVIVRPGDVEAFLAPLPIKRLWGVGPRMRAALEGLGLYTIGKLAAADRELLAARFGQHGEHLHELAQGRDRREVVPDWDAKSYSHEETFARNRGDPEFLEGVLLDQAHRVARRMRRDRVSGRVVQLKLRDGDFVTITRRATLSGPTRDPQAIYAAACRLLHAHWQGAPVRLIGVGMSAVSSAGAESLDLFAASGGQERRRKLAATIDEIESRFGRGKVLPAKVLGVRRERGAPPPNDRPARETDGRAAGAAPESGDTG